MKTLLCLSIALGTIVSPAPTFAQTTPTPFTSAQVAADVIHIEKVAYYPADVQTAEEKVTAQQVQRALDAVGGASATGSSASGEHATSSKPAECTGPANFCNIFSGS